jgi:hypothetical protein
MPKRAALSRFGLFAFLIVVCLLAAKANRAEKFRTLDELSAPVLALKNDNTFYEEIDFQLQIKPILAHHCTSCHNPEKRRGGLQLTNRKDGLTFLPMNSMLFSRPRKRGGNMGKRRPWSVTSIWPSHPEATISNP